MPLAEGIAAGAGVGSAIAAVVPLLNNARSVVIQIDNFTHAKMFRIRDDHAHGGFAATPSSEIPANKTEVFGAQSTGGGVFVGTEGSVTYNVSGLAEVAVWWNNPFAGNNGIRSSVSGGNLAPFRVRTTKGVGNQHAHMRYEVFDSAQQAWRFCHKCMGMFFDGYPTKGSCPAGGGHEPAGFNFVLPFLLPYESQGTSNAQHDWRFCHKCMVMFFDGYPANGRCPAGGGHEPAGFNFVLPHDVPETPTAQKNWRFCHKCMAMFFDGYPANGRCPAGGGHEPAGFNFVLGHFV